MKAPGRFIVILMLILGCAFSAWAWWTKYNNTSRVMNAFGVDQARVIRHGSEVIQWDLQPDDDELGEDTDAVSIQGQSYRIVHRDEITDRRGMEHLRHALIQDSSYHWEQSLDASNRINDWPSVICFRDGDVITRLALDLERGRIMLLPDGPILNCTPCLPGLRVVLIDENSAKHE